MRSTVPFRSTAVLTKARTRAALVLGLVAILVAAGANMTAASAATQPRKPVFVIYYLWWTANHWQDRLGPNYPHSRTPSPLPATQDPTGCGTKSSYAGNKLADVSPSMSYDQNDAAVIERDVRLAASLGVKGFTVNWKGTGSSSQTPASDPFNRRLQYMFDAVHKVNAEGTPFKLQLNYQASAQKLSTTTIKNDLNYFLGRYGSDSALDHTYSVKPELIWAGSWKYTNAEIATVSRDFRTRMHLLGDEKPTSWNSSRAANLDGATWYWSSQNPYRNPQSFTQLRNFADTVHSGRNPDGRTKTWLAPFAPGYNAQLLYGGTTCVPRHNGQTMHRLFQGNQASNPDGWTLISWNEIAEGTYIVPLTRYGSQYTNELKTLITNNG
jgi:hypothetical protein